MHDVHDLSKEVRDPIYGLINLSSAEWEIVNTPTFQRLRDVKQLAMGHMVYPGATHTRFEHSLGCVHLSDLLICQLQKNAAEVLKGHFSINQGNFERARRLLRLAALLHDVGHPPFSHSGEDLMPFALDEKGAPTSKRLSHEDMTATLIRDTEIGEKIRQNYHAYGLGVEDVVAVATAPSKAKGNHATAYNLILTEMLTGDLGSDRIDYLLRDGYHSGQKAGQFDHQRLISEIQLVPRPPADNKTTNNEAYALGFGEGAWAVAEQMIAARYIMYINLYFHKTKRIYEIHLNQFTEDFLKSQGGTFPRDPRKYCGMSDSTILAAITSASLDLSAAGHSVADRFTSRGHMRLAKELVLADNFRLVKIEGDREFRRVPDRARFDRLKKHVSIKFGTSVLFDEPYHSATKIFDTHNILVVLDKKTRYLEDISEIVRGMSARIWRGRIYANKNMRDSVHNESEAWLSQNPQSPNEEAT